MGKVSKALNKAQIEPRRFSPGKEQYHGEDEQIFEIAQKRKPVHSVHQAEMSSHVGEQQKPKKGVKDWDERLLQSSMDTTGMAEGIRKLRTMLLSPHQEKEIQTVLVLSSDPHEGKSFVCANLGISIAKSVEHDALLVDCDLRRPSLHKLFGLQKKEGLAEYLNYGRDVDSLICESGLPDLKVIPAGKPPPNPAELLSSERMTDFVEELMSWKRDRLLVFDTPPFYAASETLSLIQMVDKIVLVVRWGRVGREQIKKMVDTIGRDKIIGIVFNAFEMNILDKKLQGVGYRNYYSEYY